MSSMQGGRVYGDIIWQGHGMSRTFALNELSFHLSSERRVVKGLLWGFSHEITEKCKQIRFSIRRYVA